MNEAIRDAGEAVLAERRLIIQLSSCPKTLHSLWTEYQHGIGGRKAAKDFTLVERGANKFSYSRRKTFWECITKHVNARYTAAAAIDKVHASYGEKLSVTKILNLMIADKKSGGHPNLQI